jgi:nucleoside-diphosphate-sugar epimerase
MKYLVLGSDGQIGNHLVRYLTNQGHTVFTFDIASSSSEDLRIDNNSLLIERMLACDFVYFLAFDVGGSRYLKQYQNTYEFISNNIKIMDNTFSCLKETGKPFLFASSQMSNMDYSSYGILKRIGEYYTDTLQGLVVKCWNVYGIETDETKSHVITDFIRKALDANVIDMMTDGSEERQFLFADDCCDCFYRLSLLYGKLDRSKEYHVTSFEWAKIVNVAEYISNSIPCKIIPSNAKDTIQQDARNEPNPWILNYWKPSIGIRQGVAKMCDYYREQYKHINQSNC